VTVELVVLDDEPTLYSGPEDEDLLRLKPVGDLTIYAARPPDRAEFVRRIAQADVVISIRPYSRFDEDALNQAARLRLLCIVGTGTDHVDLHAATQHGVTVTNTPGVNVPSVAELALGLMIAAARAIPLHDARLHQGNWGFSQGTELAGKTLGVLGLGAIGQYTARLARGIGMHVIAWSWRPDLARAEACGIKLVERDELFRQSDVVSLHLRSSPEAVGIVGRRELFELMKPSAILINTARGALVDELALAEALHQRRIAAAGLDVFAHEPLVVDNNPFMKLDNVVLMPHAGAITREAIARVKKMPVTSILSFLAGQPQHVVPSRSPTSRADAST
jgi:phosphoglycerate dehydrogenase-like enzyme